MADADAAGMAGADAAAIEAGAELPIAYRVCATTTRDPDRTFCDATETWGVHARYTAPPQHGEDGYKAVLSVADFDGDGRPDVWTSIGADQHAALLLNRGGRFDDVSGPWGVRDIHEGEASAAADLDGDGDPDLLAGGGGVPYVRIYRNDHDHLSVGADLPLGRSGMVETIVPADLDRDGMLDVLVGVYRFDGSCPSALPNAGCPGAVLAFRQTGPLQFTPIPVDPLPRSVQGLRLFDWDDDGQDEVLVSTDFGPFNGANVVLRVDRSGGGLALRDATAGTGFDVAIFGMGIATVDADGDGRDEVLVSNIGRNVLLRRTARHAVDVAVQFGADAYGMAIGGMRPAFRALDRANALEGPIARFRDAYLDPHSPLFPTTKWPPVVLDFDDDGRRDVFIPAGGAVVELLPLPGRQQSMLLRGTGARFENVTASAGLGSRHDARCAVAADFDGDGDDDLVIQETATAAADGGLRFVRNDVSAGNAITVVAHGRGTATDGIGAMVEVRAGGRTLRRRLDGSLSLFGSGPHELHAGLGAAAVADSVTVRFPSGTVRTRSAVGPGRIVIEE